VMRGIPEANVVKKDWRRVDLRVALCYPNIYRVGMTGLPIRLLYALLNSREDVACERFFKPTLDEPLLSLESHQPLWKFDVVAFSLQYEWDYANALWMLMESGIPPRSGERGKEHPIVIAGGPCAIENPLPLSRHVDLFIIGEAEEVLDRVVDAVINHGRDALEELSGERGVYVPSMDEHATRVWVKNLDEAPHPTAQVVPLVDEKSPYMTTFGRAIDLEVTRGCGRGCKFCLIGHTYRPMRHRSLEKLEEILTECVKWTPAGKVSIIGAALSDHPDLEDVCQMVVDMGLELSIPSIRPEAVTERLAELLVGGGQRRVTMAPDAATENLRRAIRKGISEEEIMDAAKTLLKSGVRGLKLYFMVGLPGERREDVDAIAQLARKIADLGYPPKSIHLSINPLVPKPHTPFQREPFADLQYIRECIRRVRQLLKGDRRITINGLDPRQAQIQAALSLGGEELGVVIERAARLGGGLSAWRRAFRECGLDLGRYLGRKPPNVELPWERIGINLNRNRG